jgi:hypothetical protein
MSSGSASVFVPATEMGRRYIEAHAVPEPPHRWATGDRTAYQRALAQEDLEDPSALARDFLTSVSQFGHYTPREGEGFHDRGTASSLDAYRGAGKPSTNRLAARLESGGPPLSAPSLPTVSYVDRELTPSRTTSPSEFENRLGTSIILDLLLRAGSQPIVAEVKADSDENAYYALIQGLAACAQLAPQAQRARLAQMHPDLASGGPLQLWIVLAGHNSRGRDKCALKNMSSKIAAELLRAEGVSGYLSTIACVDAVIPAVGPVRFSTIWSHSAP